MNLALWIIAGLMAAGFYLVLIAVVAIGRFGPESFA